MHLRESNVPNQQHRDAQPAEPTPSRSSYRQGRRTAHREAAPSAKQGAIGTSNLPNRSIATRILPQCSIEKQLPQGDGAKHHREAAPQRKARHHRGVTAGRETARLHREAASQRKARHLRESNLPNQQHRDAHPANQQHREEQPAEPAPSE